VPLCNNDQRQSSLQWDQFSANFELFGVSSESFDETFESIYTTRLDRSSFTSAQEAKAKQIANQIRDSAATCTNAHIAEERGHAVSTDRDGAEEERYSAVCHSEDTNARASDLVCKMLGISPHSDTASNTSQTEPAAEPEPEPRLSIICRVKKSPAKKPAKVANPTTTTKAPAIKIRCRVVAKKG
jgi:PAB1-binding protein PBP1